MKSIDDVVAKETGLRFRTMMSIILSSLLGSVPWRTMLRFLMYRHIR